MFTRNNILNIIRNNVFIFTILLQHFEITNKNFVYSEILEYFINLAFNLLKYIFHYKYINIFIKFNSLMKR